MLREGVSQLLIEGERQLGSAGVAGSTPVLEEG